MKFSEIIYLRAENELKNRRDRAERLASMRRKEFIATNPQLIDIENEMKNAALEVIKSVGAEGKKADGAGGVDHSARGGRGSQQKII